MIPAYNSALYLLQAVNSALALRAEEHEVIIVDDGSTDGTSALADVLARRHEGVRVIHQRNCGPAAARNSGLRVAGGEFVQFLDSDDVYCPGKLEAQQFVLEQAEDALLVFSDYAVADHGLGNVRHVVTGEPDRHFRDVLPICNWFPVTSPLVRRAAVMSVGGFDTRLQAAEDWDLWLRLSDVGDFRYVPGVVTLYRTHERQSHRDYQRMAYSWSLVADRFDKGDPRKRDCSTSIALSNVYAARAAGRRFELLAMMGRLCWAAKRPSRMRRVFAIRTRRNKGYERAAV